jgi:hypothetical protein
MITKDSSIRGDALVSGMLLSAVTTLQDDYEESIMRCVGFWDATIFCNNLAR